MRNLPFLLMGTVFGILLTKAEVISWFKIRNMFYFREPDLYLIIGSAVLTGMAAMAIIRKLKLKALNGEPISVQPKEMHRGVFLGGFIFGVGWFITGTCPGPIYAQLGAGEYMAFATLIGALLGTLAYGKYKRKLPH